MGLRMMNKALLAACVLIAGLVSPLAAQDRVTLGWGRLFNNDAIGDGQDRWRTGSYTVSQLRGESWSGVMPEQPGAILEFRFRGETIAPVDLLAIDPNDRRYVGALSLGVHTHFGWQGNEISLGGDLVVTGPQTGIGSFQGWIHRRLGLAEPKVLDDQIGNGIYPTLVGEIGRTLHFGTQTTLHPFVEARAGAETLVRVGGDLVFGEFGQGDLMLRDPTTGQRYRGVAGVHDNGFSLVLGADVAQVFSSVFLPAGEAVTPSDTRTRARAGVQWQGSRASGFYGVTYLGPEFNEQKEGQFVGSLNVNFSF